MFSYITSRFAGCGGMIAAVLIPTVMLVGSARAEAPVGNKFVFASIFHDQAHTIFTKEQNPNGIHLRSVVMTCAQNTNLFALTPRNKAERIAFCAYTSNFGSSQFYDVMLPAGWGLEFAAGGDNGDADANEIAITYDRQ